MHIGKIATELRPGGAKELVLLLCFAFLLWYALSQDALLTGDAHEYVRMTVSLARHGSAELRNADVVAANRVSRDLFAIGPHVQYHYTEATGTYHSIHFWAYSLLNVPLYCFCEWAHLPRAQAFLWTNCLLLLAALWVIVRLLPRECLWLLLFSITGPVLFYLRWIHPEVMVFSLLTMACVFYTAKRYTQAVFFSSLASLQAAPLSLFTACFALLALLKQKTGVLQVLRLAAAGALSLVPYAYFFLSTGHLTLIPARLQYMGVEKALSLFLDPNLGLIGFVPLLLLSLLLLPVVGRAKQRALLLAAAGIAVALAYTSQFHWNHGMMYLSRYAFVLLPPAYAAVVLGFADLRKKWARVWLILCLITGAGITTSYMLDYNTDNYYRFTGFTRWLIRTAPAVYNPYAEIYLERASGRPNLHKFKQYMAVVPIVAIYGQGPRQVLLHHADAGWYHSFFSRPAAQSEGLSYVNFGLQPPWPYHDDRLIFFHRQPHPIFHDRVNGSFFGTGDAPGWGFYPLHDSAGWYTVEAHPDGGSSFIWIGQEASLHYLLPTNRDVQLKIRVKAFYRPRHLCVSINGRERMRAFIASHDISDLSLCFRTTEYVNRITFSSPEQAERPMDVLETSTDSRAISFAFYLVAIDSLYPQPAGDRPLPKKHP